MIQSILFLIIGTVMLYYGAEWAVRSGSLIARRLGISRLVIGLTIVAFGTSLPELIVSIVAAIEGNSTIAIGNVVGSNIANVGLVLGLSAIIFPIIINFKDIQRDFYIYLGVCAIFLIFIFDGRLSRFEGGILFISLVFYLLIRIKSPRGEKVEITENGGQNLGKHIFLIIIGFVLLAEGANLFVSGAVALARFLGVSEIVIGMSIVAFGTSLPELATSVMAAFRKEGAISIGNIIGSNIFNILSVLGLAAMIHPLNSPRSILKLEIPFMIGFGLVMIPIALMSQPIHRFVSFLLLLGYGVFLVLLF
ncbi:MAG: calcium/sodium antiporter [Fidelibacterota bacterium]